MLISGEAGVGKSRLLAQFASTVVRDSRPRFFANADCVERSDIPLGPFRRLIASLELPFPNPPEHERTELFEAIATLLRDAASKRATILTIEDLHWADSSSLEFLTYLAPRIVRSRLLLVCTFRSSAITGAGLISSIVGRLDREPVVARIELETFDDRAMAELVDGALRGRVELPEPTRRDVVRRSEGNPFFAEELLKSALERGTSDNARLPKSIRAAMTDRLEILSAEDRRILSQAAVVGYRFDAQLLAHTLKMPLDDVLPALRRGRDHNVIVEEDDVRGRFRFRHALTHQAVYEAMLQFDARRMHASILKTLEEFGDAERHIDALAHHAWEARDVDRAVRYNDRAGRAALAIRSLPEARACFERALEFALDGTMRAELFAQLGQVSEMQGSLAESIANFTSACAHFKEERSFDRAAEMVRFIASNRNNLGDMGTIAFLEAFLEEYESRLSGLSRDMLLTTAARLASIQNKPTLQAEFITRIRKPDDLLPRGKQNYLLARMDLHYFAGDVAGLAALVPALFETAELLPPFIATIALYRLGQLAAVMGLRDISDRSLDKALELEERWHFEGLRRFGATIRAYRAWLWGDISSAQTFLRIAHQDSEIVVTRMSLALVAPLVAFSAGGDGATITREIEDAIDDLRSSPATLDDARILAGFAQLGFSRGKTVQPLSDLRAAFAAIERPSAGTGALLHLAAEHLTGSEIDRLTLMVAPSKFFPEDVVGRTDATLTRAILEHRFGDDELSEALAREAATAYRVLGWPLFEARAREVAKEFEAANAIYERCGAAVLLGAGASRIAAVDSNKLSGRESEIARMIAHGATNFAIGESLNVRTKTVEKHVSSIFRKLGVSKRTQIAAHVAGKKPL